MLGRLIARRKLKALIAASMKEMASKTDANCEGWGLGSADRWDADYEAGTLTFSFPDRRVVAPIQVIGTYSIAEGSWLWSWDNASVEMPLIRDAELVQAFGEREGYERLTTPKLFCSEYDCWELTAVACSLAKAQGVYQAPSGDLRTFMTFGPVTVHPLS